MSPSLVLLLLACFGAACDIEQEAWALLPDDAVQCRDPACMADSVESGMPAVFIRSRWGVDSEITTAEVWTGDRYWVLNHDSFSSGRVKGFECVGPVLGGPELDCEAVEPEGNHYLVCGRFPGGSPAPLPFEP